MIAALLPAKALDQAKERLAAVLSRDERRLLELAMLEDVVTALRAVPAVGSIHIVSPDEEVVQHAAALGTDAILVPHLLRGLNQSLTHAVTVMSSAGPVPAVLVLLADVPAVAPADIASVIDALPAHRGAVICPSHDGGTNALALRPPDAIPFRFGPQSSLAHLHEAAARGVSTHVLHLPSLDDIDAPRDLRAFVGHPTDTATYRLLARIGIAERLREHAL